ncbi:regulatory protein GntR HTH [Ruminiclostridium papyrosolvens DSM 2782]|uniref:Regulatory protein GntR HTH n=1 Tax=Ruminiclostridium papyrosolvens DSM 2782 TaxID=588581 RepID=F1T999_9FIRM|nr:FadR/GntR family transcriptional regulator [Ruminiclostridium papyrosolvens]EGD49081.1 regulatory protein GntR HTH [Ruminiclostridium papyrosolvens DSM 2782]WES35561.1 FadR/GntR family transcriptional regulator [Ruminiclostridium papyrosolvens DSM 2782]
MSKLFADREGLKYGDYSMDSMFFYNYILLDGKYKMEEKKIKRSVEKPKINRVSVVEQICSLVKQDIANGVWNPGDKLPTEAKFSEIFGVNRLSVRMALQKLSTLGIIETRVGEGSFVRTFSLRPFLSEIAVFYDDDDKYNDVQQLRNFLEGECMNLAILYASQEEKDELKEVLEQYHESFKEYKKDIDNAESLEKMVDADFEFHCQVVKMSHNKLYNDIYYIVHQLIRRHITKLISTRAHRRREADISDDTHERIYQGIITADRETVRKAREEVLGIIPIQGVDL